ncbi:CPS_collapsed_G0048950.mRNA.1.CDS.1 [Saccharomyces cerevisiae]|nr:CPS_collapsed_G0048950.mRNA.1.CDS.1 [Saccharomyces cerevisiae]
MSDSQQSITVLEELFRKLETATSETREGISSELSSFLNGNIIEHDVPEVFFDEFQKAIQSKQKALNTLGAVAYIANETNLSPSVEPYIVATVPSVCSKAGSKDNDVQLAATKALKAIASAVNPVAVKALLPHLIHSLETSNKWKEKVAVLEVISVLVDAAKEQIALRMPELIPVLSESMWDTKKEVKEAATATITKATETVDNKDIERFIPKLIECIANPNEVPETVHLLGATTFCSRSNSSDFVYYGSFIEQRFSRERNLYKT